jgi:glucose/arabinose dehydrogenase
MNRLRTLLLSLVLLVGAILLGIVRASAQTQGPVQVINLSESGFEQAHSVAFSPDGKFLAVGGTSGVYLVDFQKLSITEFIQTNTWAHSVAFKPGSNTLAAGLFDSTIKTWNVPAAKLLQTINGPSGWVRNISFSADGSLLASASDDNTIRIWQMGEMNLLLVLDQNTTGVRAVALSPDGTLVAGALGDKTVRVWKVPSGALLYTLRGHEDWVRCLAFSPDGQLLASGSFDKTIRLWDVTNGALKQTLKGHSSSVLGVAFSPDGKTLASGSVDETVRLWNVSDGNPIRVLQGHSDFVYAVAFSPDGQTLASGSGDNTVRLWDMNVLGKPDTNTQLPTVSTPSDCRLCHHSRGQGMPPRVIELRCEGCHPSGANLEWCPGFPRSPEAVTQPVHFTPYTLPAGVPVSGNDISVLIASPSNGETVYAGNGLTAAVYVTGKIFSANTPLTDIQVQLDIWSGDQNTATVTSTPLPSGQFKFSLSINPQGAIPYIIKPGGADCVPCHEDFRAQAPLPNGDVRLVVTIIGPHGQQASDERWIKVDASGVTRLPVEVIDAISHQPLPGIQVQASTVVYEWRARFGNATTQQDGTAQLDLNQLAQFPTLYTLSIAPTVYNGELYSSDKPVTVVLTPGTDSYKTVTLIASALSGQIKGDIKGANLSDAVRDTKIWAIQLPAGPAYETQLTSENTFTFEKIPVSKYLVTLDNSLLSKQGLFTTSRSVDLLQNPASTTSFSLEKGRSIHGQVSTKNGDALPFAWIGVGDTNSVATIDPTSGAFDLSNVTSKANFITVTAPGYYSLPLSVKQDTATLDAKLTPRPETKLVPWGDGQVILPSETKGTVNGLEFNLEYGWLWGQNTSSQPLTIHLPDVDIHLSSRKFALEQPADGTGWLYVQEGLADIIYNGSPEPVKVGSGQMIAMVDGASPFPINSAVIRALHPARDESPVFEVIEPSPGSRLSSWLAKTGIGAMQTITFITYILSLVTLIAIPVIVLFSYQKMRRKSSDSQENH